MCKYGVINITITDILIRGLLNYGIRCQILSHMEDMCCLSMIVSLDSSIKLYQLSSLYYMALTAQFQ